MTTRLSMLGNLKSALTIMRRASRADSISMNALKNAEGVVFLSSLKGAWFFSGALGRGIFLKRNDDGSWSNPVAIVLAQGGAGFQFGLHKEQVLIVLNSRRAVRRFENFGSLQITGDISVTTGVGAVLHGGLAINQRSISGVSAFGISRGLFFGLSLEGMIVATNPQQNWSFYQTRGASQKRIFAGVIAVPEGRKREAIIRLHHALENLSKGLPLQAQAEILQKKIEEADNTHEFSPINIGEDYVDSDSSDDGRKDSDTNSLDDLGYGDIQTIQSFVASPEKGNIKQGNVLEKKKAKVPPPRELSFEFESLARI
mmetsp:Transcript_18208/g.35767  ORF Transcript_18208/g.35767 Transcript_18208/m.35767 type:complete len:314 (-) Transcript_18208:159-1100(-)|eukprot:CAMPEP_0171504758 /NCGR_PEP_ID=MMETSP0958-20121227/11777_1 /TAXON_ID=87120 /ORGANISM="Aurantiochytrium limacinum, Strain ATCCMYA-1381" /LENGTH=313 /DNA_ID=CAMNT_0012040691 /DNA_START=200 /DNA_END=1141 /DNA_ORIENTATION=-